MQITKSLLDARYIRRGTEGVAVAVFETRLQANRAYRILERAHTQPSNIYHNKTRRIYVILFSYPDEIAIPNTSKRMISNPKKVLIYGQVDRILATKTQEHRCDPGCKRAGHRYYHDFGKGAVMYGLPDKSILIKHG